MAPRQIVGVDFSGDTRNDGFGKTWVTEAYLDHGKLEFVNCSQIKRTDLEHLLLKLRSGAVAAMDFPFSVPLAFAEHLGHSKSEMPTLWKKVCSIKTLKEFKDSAKSYAEFLRVGDLEYPNVQPPLHSKARPMINMTFYGMKLLHRVYSAQRDTPFEVPPLTVSNSNNPVLLETMPGLALHAFGLASARYKDGSGAERQERRETREKILRILIEASEIELAQNIIPATIKENCVANQGGDALDSLVAALVAARWAQCQSDFLVPTNDILSSLRRNKNNKRQASEKAEERTKICIAKTEGWIYVPR